MMGMMDLFVIERVDIQKEDGEDQDRGDAGLFTEVTVTTVHTIAIGSLLGADVGLGVDGVEVDEVQTRLVYKAKDCCQQGTV